MVPIQSSLPHMFCGGLHNEVVEEAESLEQVRRCTESKHMKQNVWGGLSSELLQRIIAYLPLSALPRCRVLSKTFNDWILSARFCRLCTELPLNRKCVVFQDCSKCPSSIGVFQGAGAACFLRYAEKWSFPPLKSHIEAVAGNLLYLECADVGTEVHHFMVCDLTAQTCSRLPPQNSGIYGVMCSIGRDLSRGHVTMVLDERLNQFRILAFIEAIETRVSDEWGLECEFDLYDSLTGRWKLRRFPFVPSYQESARLWSSVLLFDKMYCIIGSNLLSLDINTMEHDSIMTSLPQGLRRLQILDLELISYITEISHKKLETKEFHA